MRETLSPESTIGTLSHQSSKAVYQIEPLQDPRWDGLVERHPRASLFHSRAWLEALRRTYGYEPIAYTTSPPGELLRNALVLCRVESRLTGRRLVSLPFSDHCEPLVQHADELQSLLQKLQEESQTGQWRYIEIRPLALPYTTAPLPYASARYTLHRLDLKPDLQTIFGAFHKDSIQRKIKRARREGLTYETGATGSNLDTFYWLLTITRRRHGVPPQPKIWLRNLIECFGPDLQISIAFHDRTPVAGMLTIRHKNTLVYKYGGSDIRFNRLGSIHCLYWESIRRAKALGLEELDLGRSDAEQSGLITFKRRWGATESILTYFRLAPSNSPLHWFETPGTTWKARAARSVLAHVPLRVLPVLGGLLYKHMG
jgi:CelD/BcsL family acetyltransferase involved in cellulose biosynthesis